MRTNDELIRAVLNGEPAGFSELVRRYERAAWATAWKVLRDHHDSQDATQNAFVEAYRRLGQLRSSAYFGVWLLRITEHEALRIARRRQSAQPLDAAGELAAAETADGLAGPVGELVAGELVAAIGELPEHERLAVTLRYLDGHSVADVARLTGRPVGTVTKQLSRAVERLKSIFNEVRT